MKTSLTFSAAILLTLAFAKACDVYALQGPSGQVEEDATPPGVNRPLRRPLPPRPCAKGTIQVKCGLPECQIWLDGKLMRETTDTNGVKSLKVAAGLHKLVVGRLPEFAQSEPQTVMVGCGSNKTFPIDLKRRGVLLRIRTDPPANELYVDDGQGMESVRSGGADGVASYHTMATSLVIVAKKPGFFEERRAVSLRKGQPDVEVPLKLRPKPASLTILTNVDGAWALIDGQGEWHLVKDPLQISSGRHRITVEALGHAPSTVTVNLGPGAIEQTSTTLERLPVTGLVAQAETSYRGGSYADVLTLCNYIFEVDPQHPAAHGLAGLAYIARQDYVRAEPHLLRAISGGQTVIFSVRRHPREVFDKVKGHDSCEAVLALSKDRVEFRGVQFQGEDFMADYSQIKPAGLRLKKKIAVYLSVKVTSQAKKKKEYNFFSYDNELSQWGTPYLTLLQRLLQTR